MRYICFLLISIFSLTQAFAAEGNFMQSDKYFEAIKHLDKACDFAQKIKNEEVKAAVISELESCKECFQKGNVANIAEKASTLHENIDEVLAECDQDNLKTGIASCIGEMAEQFQN